mgnify:CR=1 FL=1
MGLAFCHAIRYNLFRCLSKQKGCETIAIHETIKAISDPVRREILSILKNGKMSAGEIASHFEITNATVSYHLSLLKQADLIHEIKNKNFIYYELNTTVFEDVYVWLKQFSKEG